VQQIELTRPERDRLVAAQQAPRFEIELKRTEGQNASGGHAGIVPGFRRSTLGFGGLSKAGLRATYLKPKA
jgi:hypothetical protein